MPRVASLTAKPIFVPAVTSTTGSPPLATVTTGVAIFRYTQRNRIAESSSHTAAVLQPLRFPNTARLLCYVNVQVCGAVVVAPAVITTTGQVPAEVFLVTLAVKLVELTNVVVCATPLT